MFETIEEAEYLVWLEELAVADQRQQHEDDERRAALFTAAALGYGEEAAV